MARGGAAFGEVLLAVFLGAVKGAGGFQFGDDGTTDDALLAIESALAEQGCDKMEQKR